MPVSLEHEIIRFLTDLFQTIGWTGVGVIMVLDCANFPLPSEIPMPLAGWLLVQAHGGSGWEAILLGGLWGGLGCASGSIFSYALGAWGGRALLNRYGKYLMVSSQDLEAADRWFERWGAWAAFLSRMVPLVRTFISLPAGVARARIVPFVVLSFLGSFIWCAGLAYGGYVLGARWEELRAIMRPFDFPIAAILLAGFIYYLVHHIRRSRRPAPAPQDPETG